MSKASSRGQSSTKFSSKLNENKILSSNNQTIPLQIPLQKDSYASQRLIAHTIKDSPNLTSNNKNNSSTKSNQEIRPSSATPTYKVVKYQASSSNSSQFPKNKNWNTSQKVEPKNHLSGYSNSRDNRKEEAISSKTTANTFNNPMHKVNHENLGKQMQTMEISNSQIYCDQAKIDHIKNEDQEKQYKFLKANKAISVDKQTSHFSYETAAWGPQQKTFQPQALSSIDGRVWMENQVYSNSSPELKDIQEISYQNLYLENNSLKETVSILYEQLKRSKDELLKIQENTQLSDLSKQNIYLKQEWQKQNELIEQLHASNLSLINENSRLEVIIRNQQLEERKNIEMMGPYNSNSYETQFSNSNQEIQMLYQEIEQLKVYNSDLINEKSRLEAINNQNQLNQFLEEKKKLEMTNIYNMNHQKQYYEAQLSNCSMEIKNLKIENTKIEEEKMKLEKLVEDYKSTDRILSKTVISEEKNDNSENLAMKLEKCQREIEDYKFQLRNSGDKVKLYYEGLTAALEEQISELANQNSKLETDLSAANMKLRENNIY